MTLTRLSNDDWKDLLPGKTVTLGKSTIVIEPLGVASLAKLTLKLSPLAKRLKKAGLTADNFEEDKNLLVLASELVNHAPEVLETASGIDKRDIARLPLHAAADVLRAVLEVNMEGQDSLVKNFKALGNLIRPKKEAEAEKEA
jgi:hypothetical protein